MQETHSEPKHDTEPINGLDLDVENLGIPSGTAKERIEQLSKFRTDLLMDTISDQDLQSIHDHSYERGRGKHPKLSLRHRVIAGLALSGAALLGLTDQGHQAADFVVDQAHELVTNQDNTVQPVEAGTPEAGIYNAKPGDTASSIALEVEENIDGIAGNQEHRELQHDIYKQAGADGLMPGEDIVVPASADIDPTKPNVQL